MLVGSRPNYPYNPKVLPSAISAEPPVGITKILRITIAVICNKVINFITLNVINKVRTRALYRFKVLVRINQTIAINH